MGSRYPENQGHSGICPVIENHDLFHTKKGFMKYIHEHMKGLVIRTNMVIPDKFRITRRVNETPLYTHFPCITKGVLSREAKVYRTQYIQMGD